MRVIDLRVDRMVAQGLFDEVRALVDSGVPRTATAMQAIGYKECRAAVSRATCTQDEAVAEIKLRSRQYAKRQLTWLRRNRDIHWFCRNKFPRSSRRFTICDRNSHKPWRILILYGRHP